MKDKTQNIAAWQLLQAMAYRGTNATELSKKLGVSRQSVYRILNQKTDANLRIGTLRKLADALDCDVEISITTRDKGKKKKIF